MNFMGGNYLTRISLGDDQQPFVQPTEKPVHRSSGLRVVYRDANRD